MKPAVYIETTIVSYLSARPSRDLVLAAQQQITREWWEIHRHRFDLYTSQFAVIEASAGDAAAAAARLQALAGLSQLTTSERVFDVADALIAAAALPAVAQRDAEHVAVAAVHGMDLLLTWNCRHLANVMLRDRIEEVCEHAGLRAPMICTPDELMGDEP